MALTEKQKRFVDFYVVTGQATEAARRAGYSKPNRQGPRMLSNVVIKNAIGARLKEIEDARTATMKEVMENLTAVLRGKATEEVIVTEGLGEGASEARIMTKHLSGHDRLKAAELLMRRLAAAEELADTGSRVIFKFGRDANADD